MQWQTEAEAKEKDGWERDECKKLCGSKTPSPTKESSKATSPGDSKKSTKLPTAECVDGTMSYAKHHSGACAGHGGVEEWLDED
jgi:hypothetical protein